MLKVLESLWNRSLDAKRLPVYIETTHATLHFTRDCAGWYLLRAVSDTHN